MEMTLRAALSKKKMLDKQIEDMVNQDVFAVVTPNTVFIDGIPKKTWEAKVQERFQSLGDKIKYRDALSDIIMQANVNNFVEIPAFQGLATPKDKTKKDKVSFAAAIARKSYVLGLYYATSGILTRLDDHTADYKQQVKGAEALVRERMAAEYSNTTVSVSSSERNKREEEMLKQLMPEFVDPTGLAKNIYELRQYFEEYQTEVDSALGHATEVTMVTVPEV